MGHKKLIITKPVIAKMKGANVRHGPFYPSTRARAFKDWAADSILEQGCGELVEKKPKDGE